MWGRTRSWTNGVGYASSAATNGSGMVISEEPHLVEVTDQFGNTTTIAVVLDGTTALFFDHSGSNWLPRAYYQEQLTHNMFGQEYVLTDTSGDQIRFYDSATGSLADQFKSYTDPGGNTISVMSHNMAGEITEMQRSYPVGTVTTTESLLYTYPMSLLGTPPVSNVTLRRQVNGGAWTIFRQVNYTITTASRRTATPAT